MTTPKSSRQAPEALFKDYVLTKYSISSHEPSDVPASSFRLFASSSIEGVYAATSSMGLMADNSGSIGFNFTFDGTTYKRFLAYNDGVLILCDPTASYTSEQTIRRNCFHPNTAYTVAYNIKKEGFDANHTLICPWFALSLRDIVSKPEDIEISGEALRHIKYGLTPYPQNVSVKESGVRYHRGTSPNDGRFLAVRWNCLNSTRVDHLKFETHIYENGKIEFRYAGRDLVRLKRDVTSDTGAIGIFKCYNAPNQFRDFSTDLGHNDHRRVSYELGGATFDPNFSDAAWGSLGARFDSSLNPLRHWPGTARGASVFVFSPPKNKRAVLTRLNQRDIDNMPISTRVRYFDDRRALAYVSGTVDFNRHLSASFPIKMPRFYGNNTYDMGVTLRQDLFAPKTTYLTSTLGTITQEIISSIDKSCDSWLTPIEPKVVEPYGEHDNPNLILGTNQYFLTGTAIEYAGFSLLQPLSAKTQIKFSLPVKNPITLFPTSSCIYYYDKEHKQWLVPTASCLDFNSLSMLDDDSQYRFSSEDYHGFSAVGGFVASGNHDRGTTVELSSTDVLFRSKLNQSNMIESLSTQFNKNVTISSAYNAPNTQTIVFNVDKPFLLEKAVITLPIEAGPAWFNNVTEFVASAFNATGIQTKYHKNLGGPALTVALFNQTSIASGTRGQRQTIRHLILSGTITHTYDNVSELAFTQWNPGSDAVWLLRPRGFKYFAEPSAIVYPYSDTNLNFTGSVQLNCVAANTTGMMAHMFASFIDSLPVAYYAQLLRAILTGSSVLGNLWELGNEDLYPDADNQRFTISNNVDPFSRSRQGFMPSGRAIFGQEHRLPDTSNIVKAKNPFYLGYYQNGDTTIPTPLNDKIALMSDGFNMCAMLPHMVTTPSPYLLMPGDNLVLAVAKARPAYYFHPSVVADNRFSGSYHDIKLTTGSINITLYGSFLQKDVEKHPSHSIINTNAVYESVFGNEPVLDQYENEQRLTFGGTYTDDYVTGTLVMRSIIDNVPTIITGERALQFSKVHPRDYGYNGSGSCIRASEQYQQFFELAGTSHVAQLTSPDERFYDSMMPSIDECFKADGAAIMLSSSAGVELFDQRTRKMQTQSVGFILLDCYSSLADPDFSLINNWNWTKSFPFEPRYSQAHRQRTLEKGFIATYALAVKADTPTASAIDPAAVSGLYPWFISDAEGVPFDIWADFFYDNRTFNTGTLSTNDMSRFMFGFGDGVRASVTNSDDVVTIQLNHLPISRCYSRETVGVVNLRYHAGPQIRGWKYGVYSGIPTYNKAHWRFGHYGQFRDMLEQRLNGKFFVTSNNKVKFRNNSGVNAGVVRVQFVDADGVPTTPENTQSQNLSTEATSSVPYFDGEIKDRALITA